MQQVAGQQRHICRRALSCHTRMQAGMQPDGRRRDDTATDDDDDDDDGNVLLRLR
jgi:hypothetical protein